MITLIMSNVHFIPSVGCKMVMFNEYSAFKCSYILDIFLPAHDSLVLIATPMHKSPFNAHTDLSSGARGLNFGLSFH